MNDHTTESGSTAMNITAKNGHVDLVNLLISLEADVNKADWYDETPIYIAAKQGRAYAVAALISAGADANGDAHVCMTPSNMDTTNLSSMRQLYMHGHTDIVNMLISVGASVNVCECSEEWSPINIATADGRIDIVNALISARADVDARNANHSLLISQPL